MKKIIVFSCCLLFFAVAAFKNAGTASYTIDPKSSTIKWTGHAQTGVYSPSGTLKVKAGNVSLNEKGLITDAYIAIDMTSLHQDKEEMEAHLKGADFFDVAKFPEAIFKLSEIKGNTATGLLTIKGITHLLTFPFSISRQNDQLGIKATLQIDRTLYGIKYNSTSYFQDLGSYAIKNEFELEISLFANKPK
jgi:polyisoprenoid-binding protein YceI